MKRRRVLITGGSGLLALNWACALRSTWDVVLTTHLHTVSLAGAKTLPLRLDAEGTLLCMFKSIAPDLVVHAAALTNVDRCEAEKALAHESNVAIAQAVATVTATQKVPLVHISTDHLFAGTRSHYREEDEMEPLNEYARTKALAETRVREANPAALIVRTNFFGWGHQKRQSFSDWIISALREHRPITLFDDVFFTPILADPLAVAVHELAGKEVSGVVNVAGDERLSKFEFGLRVAERFELPLNWIQRGSVATMKQQITRPLDMSLDNAKARGLLGRSLGSVNDYLADLQTQERTGRRSELAQAVM